MLCILCGSAVTLLDGLILRPEGEGKSDGTLWWVLTGVCHFHISFVKAGQTEAGNITPL